MTTTNGDEMGEAIDDDDGAFLIYYSTHIHRDEVLWSIFICGSISVLLVF